MINIDKMTEDQRAAVTQLMNDLGDMCIIFALDQTAQHKEPAQTGAAMISALALLTVDMITTGPFSEAMKEQIFHATTRLQSTRFSTNLERVRNYEQANAAANTNGNSAD
jgi:hypothetical protein